MFCHYSSPKLSKQSCSFSTDESKESEDVDMDNDLTQYTLQSEGEKRQVRLDSVVSLLVLGTSCAIYPKLSTTQSLTH